MVIRYFGMPRSGKTTILAMLAKKYCNSKRYTFVASNVSLNLPNTVLISWDDVGKYDLTGALVLIDEASINLNSRNFKTFGSEKIEYMMLHGHYKNDFVFFSQAPDAVDSVVRSITVKTYWVHKSNWFPSLTLATIVPYGYIWPSDKDDANKGKIDIGYSRPGFFLRLFSRRIYRPLYYKYFDSWASRTLPALSTKGEKK